MNSVSPLRPTRRQFLQNLGINAGATAVLGSTALAVRPVDAPRVLRVAHLTDIHVLPDLDADRGMAEALRHAQSLPDRPDLIFFGGDLIMDALKAEKDQVLAQWDVWERVVSAELKTDAIYAIGNHDVWGWARPDGARLQLDAPYGKALALERLGLRDRYWSFDRAGWHFVVLDSTHPAPGTAHGYTARLDDEQLRWLVSDLGKTPTSTPICVLSHIPILAMCPFLDGDNESTGDWAVPGAWMHVDARRLKDLFRAHPNVRLCLSGHVHLADDVTYLGVRYCCNGAVSGGWWQGAYQEFGPAYAVVDFYADGSADNQLIFYRA
jgi:3',5'-cyclic-AMP phosphodiesterase